MARERVAPFAPPTALDFEQLGRDGVRPGPRGGFLWVCETPGCRQAASHLTVAGVKRCKNCGGSTARQRNLHADAGASRPRRTRGRPVKHGFYAVVPSLRIDVLVERYRAELLDPDETDTDMLYLRAYLEELRTLSPSTEELQELWATWYQALRLFLEETRRAGVTQPESGPWSVDQILEQGARLDVLVTVLAPGILLLKEWMRVSADLEAGHTRLIRRAKVRVQTRARQSVAAQLAVFTEMVARLIPIQAEILPTSYAQALQARYAKELNALPGRAVKHPAGGVNR